MEYIAGQGYRDGYNDRMSGQPNRCPLGMTSATSDRKVYWEEYATGYAEAHTKVLRDARNSVNEIHGSVGRYLIE